MSFNPLGSFVPSAVLDTAIVEKAKAFRDLLVQKYPCPPDTLERIYLHWTVGHYGQDFPDYNASIRLADDHFYFDVTHNPQDNAVGVNNNSPASHTYMRNTGAFGISTDDMVFATTTDFGPEPTTLFAVEFLCAGVAAIGSSYDIDLSGKSDGGAFSGEPNVLTHAEAANLTGHPMQYSPYGPPPIGTMERWDYATLVPVPQGVQVTSDMATTVGNALRQRAHLYKAAL